jgi:hypothetical protein
MLVEWQSTNNKTTIIYYDNLLTIIQQLFIQFELYVPFSSATSPRTVMLVEWQSTNNNTTIIYYDNLLTII